MLTKTVQAKVGDLFTSRINVLSQQLDEQKKRMTDDLLHSTNNVVQRAENIAVIAGKVEELTRMRETVIMWLVLKDEAVTPPDED